MEKTSPQHDRWTACRTGEIRGLVSRLQSRRRAKFAQNVAVGASLLVVVAASYFFISSPSNPVNGVKKAGLFCRDVRQHAEAFLANQLDAETAEKVRKHIDLCPLCQKWLEEFQKGTGRQPKTGGHPSCHTNAQTARHRPHRQAGETVHLASLGF